MLKISRAALCGLAALFLFSSISAQQPRELSPDMQRVFLKQKYDEPVAVRSKKDDFKSGFLKPFGGAFWTSSAIYWIGTGADIASSQGKGFYEGNSRFRDGSGGLATGKNLVVSGGIYAVTVLLEKKWPMPMAVLRSIVGIGRGGVAWTNKHY